MSSKRVLIFGCGWLGIPLAKKLLEDNFEVMGTTTSSEKRLVLQNLGIKPVICKIGDESKHVEDLHGFNPEILIIAYPLGSRKMIGTEHLYHASWIKNNLISPNLKQVILTSSTSVYPDGYGEVDEECLHRPEGAGLKQLEFEEEILKIYKNKLIVLRLAGLIGEDRNPAYFLSGKSNLPNRNAPVNLVHQADVVSLISQIIKTEIVSEVFNVCADDHPTREEYYTDSAKRIGLIPPKFSQHELIKPKTVSNTKSKELLHFEYQEKIYF